MSPRRQAAARWPLAALALALLCMCGGARAAVVAPPPGRSVVVLDEQVTLVFDPLTNSQTTLVQLEFEGTASPFGLIFPTPKPAQVERVSDRLRRALDTTLHPRAQTQRILDVEYYSWAGSCAVREIGDVADPEELDARTPTAGAEPSGLGAGEGALHDWLLREGFTLAPAQSAWLDELRSRGWSLVVVTVRPPITEGPPHSRLRGPVLAITHEADEPIYAARMPPFAIANDRAPPGSVVPLEVAVLTEWAVSVDRDDPPEPFFADALGGRDVLRISGEAGGTPWNFRRDGTLTAFDVERPDGLGIVRFVRTSPRPAIHPPPRHELKTHRMRLPIEAILLVVGGLAWTWMRFARRNAHGPHKIAFRA